MCWLDWPYYPINISDAVAEDDGQSFVSFLVAGAAERLGRALTLIEPTKSIALLSENDGALKRIDPPDRWQRCESFCHLFRQQNGANQECERNDLKEALKLLKSFHNSKDLVARAYTCHVKMVDFICPFMIARRIVGAALSGQFAPHESDKDHVVTCAIAPRYGNQDAESLRDALDHSQRLGDYWARGPHRSDTNGVTGSSFATVFTDTIKELQSILEAAWLTRKRGLERKFVDGVRAKCVRSGEHLNRSALKSSCDEISRQMRDYLGAEYVAAFVTQQERISLKPNQNLLEVYCGSGIDRILDGPPLHVNWRKSGLDSREASNPRDAHTRLAIKGVNSNFFSKSIAAFSYYLSDKHRAVILVGPIKSLSRVDLEHELPFVADLLSVFGNWLLLQLDAVDSEAMSRSWWDTAALLAHNARRALSPVDGVALTIRSYLDGNVEVSRELARKTNDVLFDVVSDLGAQLRSSIECYAANAEGTYDFQLHDISSIIASSVRLAENEARRKSITITIAPSAERLGAALVDRPQFSMALGHLVDNAVKYSHQFREVEIRGKRDQNMVVVEIDDYGLGIADDESELIYERQQQGSRSLQAENEPGEGWGLYHARAIARAHGGDVSHTCKSGPRRPGESRLTGYRVVFSLSVACDPIREKGRR